MLQVVPEDLAVADSPWRIYSASLEISLAAISAEDSVALAEALAEAEDAECRKEVI